jgi:putative transcriptional regulator
MSFDVKQLRAKLGLAQPEFGQLFGVHPMTVSRWERQALTPSPYQQALMTEFNKAAVKNKVEEELKSLLVAAGVAAAIYFLLKLANK